MNARLGEMHFLPFLPTSWYNLPRDKGVAFAAQESWVQNETIRDNILFGAPYDEERYKKGMPVLSKQFFILLLRYFPKSSTSVGSSVTLRFLMLETKRKLVRKA